jgi:hypothetical protein
LRYGNVSGETGFDIAASIALPLGILTHVVKIVAFNPIVNWQRLGAGLAKHNFWH